MNRVSFSDSDLTIEEIWQWYEICLISLNEYRNKVKNNLILNTNVPIEFINMTLSEVDDYFKANAEELENMASLNLLSMIEAKFRIDFFKRVYDKKRDNLSKTFRELHRQNGSKISLEEDILESWKNSFSPYKNIISEIFIC